MDMSFARQSQLYKELWRSHVYDDTDVSVAQPRTIYRNERYGLSAYMDPRASSVGRYLVVASGKSPEDPAAHSGPSERRAQQLLHVAEFVGHAVVRKIAARQHNEPNQKKPLIASLIRVRALLLPAAAVLPLGREPRAYEVSLLQSRELNEALFSAEEMIALDQRLENDSFKDPLDDIADITTQLWANGDTADRRR